MAHVRRDLVYAEHPGYRPLSLDLHLPDAPHPPVVLFLHGGGWRVGSRRTFVPGLAGPDGFGRITAEGWAVAAVDYRLSGEARWPAQLADVTTAIDWVTSATEVDGSRLVLWGESAGGHLAALAGLRDPRVRGVIDWYGPADLRTMPGADEPQTREAALLGMPAASDPDLAAHASPVASVSIGAPPFHIAHGDDDRSVPVAQSEELARALRRVGADVTLQIVPGADHLWRGLGDPATVLEPALAFLRRIAG